MPKQRSSQQLTESEGSDMEIYCSDGTATEVDWEDWIYFTQQNWTLNGKGRHVKRTEKESKVYLHIAIWEKHYGKIPNGKEIDHIDRNPLNNKKENLRLATRSQNQANRNLQKNNTSGMRGVCFHKSTNKWQACIKVNGKLKYIGLYTNIKDAAIAYNIVAKHYFGEFAFQNNLENI